MKIAVIGIDFSLGKKTLSDERLEKLKEIFHSPKVTYIQLEFCDEIHIKEASSILSDKNKKFDLIIDDLEIIENRLAVDYGNKDLFLRLKDALEKETLLNEITLQDEEIKLLLNFNLVTLKPITFLDKENLPSLSEIIRNVYTNCGMISFFTVNERELRAWPIKSGTTVYEAAGFIHSDIQRGFIKAEVVSFEDLIKSGSLNQAKDRGLIRLEDKGYIVKDGDLIQIRFNV